MTSEKDFKDKFGELASEIEVDKFGLVWMITDISEFKQLLSALREEGFDHLSTITGYDDGERIHLIYHLVKFNEKQSDEVNVVIYTDREDSKAPSILDLYPSALVYEREVYDLLGVKFEGHKGLKRLLLPEDVPEDFHPLRKDFKLNV